MRQEVLQVLGVAAAQMESIQQDDQWEWARNPQNSGKLEGAVKALRCQFSAFHKRWLSEEPTDLKRLVDNHTLANELAAFLGTRDSMDRLSQTCAQLAGRHNLEVAEKPEKT